MAKEETDIVNNIMVATSPRGVRLFRNVRGLFLTLDGKRKVKAGLLADGASDLVGFTMKTITPEMVGRKIAVFTAFEVKTATGVAFDKQKDFIAFIRESGGIAGVTRSPVEAHNMLDGSA